MGFLDIRPGAGCGQARAIGTEGQRTDTRQVVFRRREEQACGNRVPDPGPPVAAAGSHTPSVRAERCLLHPAVVTVQNEQLPARFHFQKAGRVVGAARDHALPIGAEGDTEHPVRVRDDGSNQDAGRRLPESGRAVLAARQDQTSVWTPSYSQHSVGVTS